MIAGAHSVAGGEIRDAPPQVLECISAGSLNRITGGILANSVGATSDASHACMVEFAANHSHYIGLARAAAADPEALTPEEYVELAEDDFKNFQLHERRGTGPVPEHLPASSAPLAATRPVQA